MTINSVSFKGYIPVKFYAKNPANQRYSRVIQHQNLRKCHGFVVRNLNGTKKELNTDFINAFREIDKDYREIPQVTSMYDENRGTDPIIYMITGKDIDIVKQMAKPVGLAKADSIERLGNANSFEAKYEANNYIMKMKQFLAKNCRRIKNGNGEALTLKVYFDPVYNRKNEVKSFNYVGHDFVAEG